MRIQKLFLAGLVALAVSSVWTFVSAGSAPSVGIDIGPAGISVVAPPGTQVVLHVGTPDGQVITERSENGLLNWNLQAGLPDGLYRYDVYVSSDAPGESDEGSDSRESPSESYRKSGRFNVRNGVPVDDTDARKESGVDDEISSPLASVLLRMTGAMLDVLVPPAAAQDLTTSSVVPTVNHNDTNPVAGGGARNVVDVLAAESSVSPCSNASTDIVFEINAVGNSSADMISICSRGNAADNTMIVDPAGDMTLANGAVFIDRSADSLGIGTVTPGENLHVFASSAPTLRLEDLGQIWDIGESASDLDFTNVTDGVTVMTLQDTNNSVGIGTQNPNAPLHLFRTDGTAQVLIQEQSAAATLRQLFRIENNGDPSFVFQDSSSGADTEFRLFGGSDSFAINHITGGVSGAEFRLDRDGDLFISGALSQNSDFAAKTAITAVMPIDVLGKVEALPISTWQYKADEPEVRHLGPMAQDFHAAFGLGENETGISPGDMAGVALAAIQAQQGLIAEQQQRLDEKDAQISELQRRLAAIEVRLSR